MEKWIKLPLSLMGRILLMNMVVLPRLLFLFTNIPMVLPKVFFHRLTTLMIRLAWAGKQARAAWQVLTLPCHLGGLGAPDFELYYRTAQAAQVYHWIHGPPDIPHIRIETMTAAPLPLPALLFQHADRRTGILGSVTSTTHAWQQLLQMQAGALLYSPATLLEWCQWLPSCRDKGVVSALNTLDLCRAGDLFLEGKAKTWSDIDTDNNTPTLLTHFQFHRTRHALRDILGEDFTKPPEILALTHMINAKSPAHIVSKLYQLCMAHRAHTYTKARLSWQRDLQQNVDDKTWTYCCASIGRVSLIDRHRLLHFKYLNRTYHNPERLHRFGLRDSPACERCSCQNADFYHLAWTCPEIHKFWNAIFKELGEITEQGLTPDPLTALLGYTKQIPKGIRRLVDMGLLLPKCRVAMCWARGPNPTIAQWAHDMLYCSTQTENFSDLLPLRSRPKNFWGLYKAYAAAKAAERENTTNITAE